MIPRYTRPEMGRIWSDQNRFQQWLEVELAATEALAELGVVPFDAATLLRQHAGFEVKRICLLYTSGKRRPFRRGRSLPPPGSACPKNRAFR